MKINILEDCLLFKNDLKVVKLPLNDDIIELSTMLQNEYNVKVEDCRTEGNINKIENARIISGLSQSNVAQLVGITRQGYIKIENGESTPNVTTAIKLAKVFNVTVEDLF